jgi:hypothetical protein
MSSISIDEVRPYCSKDYGDLGGVVTQQVFEVAEQRWVR